LVICFIKNYDNCSFSKSNLNFKLDQEFAIS